MLLGIALVIEDPDKGHKLAFRYPAPYKKDLSDEHVEELKAALSGRAPDRNLRESRNAVSTPVKYSGDEFDHVDEIESDVEVLSETMWKFNPSTFARLLTPHVALCGKKFELVIDNLRFISYPVQIPRKRNEKSPLWAKSEISMFNVVFILDATMDKVVEESKNKLGIPPGQSSYGVPFPGTRASFQVFREGATKIAVALEHEEKRNGFVTNEAKLMLNKDYDDKHSSQANLSSDNDIILAGRTNDQSHETSLSLTPSNLGGNDVQQNLSSFSQTRHHWRTSEIARIPTKLRRSRLARDLRRIYHSLREGKDVKVCFQGTVRTDISLQSSALHPTHPLRPYQTFLFDSSFKLEDEFFLGSSNDMYLVCEYLLEHAPFKSFHDVSEALDEPLSVIYTHATNLLYWSKGQIINTVSRTNMYRISPNASFLETNPVFEKFDSFLEDVMGRNNDMKPNVTVPSFLSLFCSKNDDTGLPLDLGAVLDSSQKKFNLPTYAFLEIVVFLLQNDMLVQLQTYIYIFVPTTVSRVPKVLRAGDVHAVGESTDRRDDETKTARNTNGAPTQFPQQTVASDTETEFQITQSQTEKNEIAYLKRISIDTKDFFRLKQLRPYFHGQHSLEEIMFQCGISRAELKEVIATHSDILFSYLCERV